MIRPLLWLPLFALCVGSAHAQEESLEARAKALHALAGGEWCDGPDDEWFPEDDYSEWTFSYQPGWSEEAEPEEVTLVRLFCMSGAYNVTHAYYIERDFEGLMPLAFATPTLDVRYIDDDIDAGLESLAITGIGATTLLVNSDFDPETLTITSYSKWRGIGDASGSGTWIFADGEFSLKRYDVDASYDGEMNPETLIEYE